MIVKKQKQSKKKTILYIIVIAVMIGLNTLYYLKNQNSSTPNNSTNNIQAKLLKTKNAQSVAQNTTLLDNQSFKKLIKTGNWPVQSQRTGRANPTLPYNQATENPDNLRHFTLFLQDQDNGKSHSNSKNLQKSLLENESFKNLSKRGNWPVEIQKVGRVNPFLPYFEE